MELEQEIAALQQMVGNQPDESNSQEGQESDGVNTDQRQPEPAANEGGGEDWQQKYKSLQGQFQHKQQQIDMLNQRIVQLEFDLDQARATTPGNSSEASGDSQADASSLEELAAKMVSVYGDELGKPFDALVRYVRKLEQDVNSNKAQPRDPNESRAEQKNALLTQLCPAWEQLNFDDKFIKWAGQKAPYSTRTLLEILNTAYDSGDIQGAAEIFNSYLETTSRPQKPAQGHQTPDSSPVNRQMPNASNAKLWSEQEIDQFYFELQNTTKWVGKEADANAIEAEIHKAYIEGRVR